jgi:uncharacterized repeat protein (TIGR01451 family)
MPRFELLEDRLTPAVHDLTQNTTFTTIQAAINAANPGDTILADAGVYAESVTVNKPLVLEGAQHGVDAQNGRPGAQESILDAATNNGQTLFNITASNVTIDGFTVQNATNANQFGFGILMGAGTSGTQLLNNIVQDNIAGIALANNSTSNQTVIRQNLIQNNNQPGPVTGTGIYSDQFSAGGTLSDVLIDNNTFTGNSDAGLDFSSTDTTKPATRITISNNLFDTNARGLLAFNLTSSAIRMNTFSNSTSNATADIRLFEGVNGVTITNNLLQNGAGRAVRISNSGTGAADAANIQFNQNSIAGYTGPAGIFQVDNYSGTLNATNNWWGSATGPTTPNNPGGTGQTLGDPNNQVFFSPFLTDGTNISTGRGFVPVQADLALAKTGPATATAGTQVTYTLSLANPGPSDAQGVTLTDTLPSGETFVSASEGNGAGTSFTDAIGTLAEGASRTITLVAAISPSNPAGTLTNSANVTSTTFDANLANNAATFDTTVSTSADVLITKTGPATVTAGTDITYTITTTNNGPSDAQAVMTSDTLPANTSLVSFVQDSGPPDGGALPAGASQTFTLVLNVSTAAPDGSTITNTAQATSTTSDPNANNNTATVDSTVVNSADVAITKTGPATVTAGTDVTYTLTTTNNGPLDAQSVMTSDTLPANTTLVSFVQDSGPPDGGTLPAGASQTFTLVLHVNANAADGSTLTNTAQVSSTTPDPNAANNTATVDSSVSAVADVAVTKTGPATAQAGTSFTYTITATNSGPGDAQSVVVTDDIPVSETIQGANAPPGGGVTVNGNTVTFTVGTLAAGASATATITVSTDEAAVADGTVLTNSATGTTTTTDSNSANNNGTTSTTITNQADLAVTKIGPATVLPGTDITYTITVSNAGPNTARNVVLTDAVPANTTFVTEAQTSGPAFTFSNPPTGGTGTSSGTIAAFANGASATFVIVVHADSATPANTTISNSATASMSSSFVTDTNSANDTGTATTITTAPSADVAVTKAGPATVTAGTNVTYTITVTNNGPSDAQNVTLTDTLPPGTAFVSASAGSGSGVDYSDSIGTLAAGGSDTVTLVARVSSSAANGSTITNTATVTSSASDTNAANNTATFDSTVSTSADLVITKTSPGSVPPGILRGSIAEAEGFPITYTIAVTNNGPSDSQAVVVTDMLPTGVIFNSASFSQGTTSQGGNTITANLGAVASGATVSGTIVVTPTENGTIINTASVTSSTPDPNAQNNSATAQDSVAEGAILGQGTTVNGFERSPLTNVTVGTFTHANGIEPASAFSATIDWGDFINSPGTVTLSNGVYTVQGSHGYFDEHIYPVTVTVSEENVTTVIHTAATILEELLPDGTRGTPNQRFVSEVYRDMLGRKVDAGGLAKWSAALNAGASQFQVITAIQNDSGHEFLKYEVDLLYQHYLQRSADSLGLNDGVNFLAAGGTQEQLAAKLVASPEFNDRLTTGSNDSWLDQFYVRALHRGVDPVGRAGWDQAFAAGETRAQVAVAIFSSDEYRQVLVNDFYLFLLERPADQSGLSTWSGALRSGVRDEVVMASIMDTDSHEFFNKTAP